MKIPSSNNSGLPTNGDNSRSYNFGFSTGILINYKISEKITVASGLNFLDTGRKSEETWINTNFAGFLLQAGLTLGKKKVGTVINSGILIDKTLHSLATDHNGSNSSPGFRSWALIYSGNIEITYRMYNRLHFYAGPSIKYFLTSLYQKNEPVKVYPYSFGLQAGFKYSF
jgi:hypothetical protein